MYTRDSYGELCCPDCGRPLKSTGELCFYVDGDWLCQKCFRKWAIDEVSDIDLADALMVMTMGTEAV
jgi:tRNA(Ile2) C34 agmatinyltransferase TiaS